MLPQRSFHVFRLVIDAGIKAQFLHHVLAFFRTAGQPHGPRAFDLGNLAHGHAHRTRRAGNHDCVTGFQRSNFQQTKVSGQPGHSERAQKNRQRRQPGINLVYAFAIGQRIFLHAKHSYHVIADSKARVL